MKYFFKVRFYIRNSYGKHFFNIMKNVLLISCSEIYFSKYQNINIYFQKYIRKVKT